MTKIKIIPLLCSVQFASVGRVTNDKRGYDRVACVMEWALFAKKRACVLGTRNHVLAHHECQQWFQNPIPAPQPTPQLLLAKAPSVFLDKKIQDKQTGTKPSFISRCVPNQISG